MVDLNRVSQRVQEAVAKIMAGDGNDDRIVDSKVESLNLSIFYNNNKDKFSGAEDAFVREKMDAYDEMVAKQQKEQEQRELEECTTQQTKDDVAKIKGRLGSPDHIDNMEEARALLLLLDDTHQNLNACDKEYIRQELINSGYGDLIEGVASNTTVNDNPPEPDKTDKPDKTPTKSTKPTKPTKPSTPPAPKANIKDKDAIEGTKIANDIVEQFEKLSSKDVEEKRAAHTMIDELEDKINSANAYTVFKTVDVDTTHTGGRHDAIQAMLNSRRPFTSLKAIYALLQQAKDFGLDKRSEYMTLASSLKTARDAMDQTISPERYEVLQRMRGAIAGEIAALIKVMYGVVD